MTTPTPEQIINGNESIAKFMEMSKGHPDKQESRWKNRWFEKLVVDGNEFETGSSHEFLLFHAHWNWLMPVFEKIKAVGADVEINLSGMLEKAGVPHGYVSISYSLTLTDMFKDEGFLYSKTYYTKDRTLIEAAWIACVEFIEWYNNQPKS